MVEIVCASSLWGGIQNGTQLATDFMLWSAAPRHTASIAGVLSHFAQRVTPIDGSRPQLDVLRDVAAAVAAVSRPRSAGQRAAPTPPTPPGPGSMTHAAVTVVDEEEWPEDTGLEASAGEPPPTLTLSISAGRCSSQRCSLPGVW